MLEQLITTSKQIYEVLLSSELQTALFPIKIVFIIFAFLFILIAVYYMRKTEFMAYWITEGVKDFLDNKPLAVKKITRKWKKIKHGMESKSEAQRKLNILNAHTLLKDVLSRKGHSGETFSEQLANLSAEQISNIEKLKDVEKECEQILGDAGYRITLEKAKEMADIFEKSFEEFELL